MTPRALALLLLVGCAPPVPGARSDAVLYGEDDRVDVAEASDPTLADGLAALVPSDRLSAGTEGVVLAPTTLEEVLGGPLCEGERFAAVPSLARCSAALIEPDLVLTAAHCVPSDAACADLQVVFGFRREGDTVAALEPTDVHRCVAREDVRPELDRVRLRLDRPSARAPYERDRAEAGSRVAIVGHPAGGPALVEEAVLVDRREGRGFVVYADLEDGSSGSPVLSEARALVGIVTAGETDYEWTGECFASRRLAAREGEGAWAADVIDPSGCSAAGAVVPLTWPMAFAIGRARRRSRPRGASAGCARRRRT